MINDFEFTLLACTKFIKTPIFHFLKVFFFPDFCKMIQNVPKKSKFWKFSCFLTDFGEIVLLSFKIFFHGFFANFEGSAGAPCGPSTRAISRGRAANRLSRSTKSARRIVLEVTQTFRLMLLHAKLIFLWKSWFSGNSRKSMKYHDFHWFLVIFDEMNGTVGT